MRAGRAEVGGEGEPPFDQRQPIAKVFGGPREQEIRMGAAHPRAPRRDRGAD